MNVSNNKRSKDSILKIQSAVCDLIHIVGLKSINIKMICEKACVNRTTFYAHYDSVEDVLYDICKQYINKAYKIFLNTQISYKERLILSLEIVKNKLEFFTYLLQNVGDLELYILEIIEHSNFETFNNLKNEKSRLSLSFIISGFIGILKIYFNDLINGKTKEISTSEVATIIINSINMNNPNFLIK